LHWVNNALWVLQAAFLALHSCAIATKLIFTEDEQAGQLTFALCAKAYSASEKFKVRVVFPNSKLEDKRFIV